MAALTDETIRRLAAFKAANQPVVTLYLDVDGRRWPRWQDCEARAELLLKRALERASANGHAKAAPDLQRVQSYVSGGLDRSSTRGLAVFASGGDLWEVFSLPVAVQDQVVINETPHVRQLESVVDNHESFGVLLADRQRARMFVFAMGALVDKSELFDELPRHEDESGDRDRAGHLPDHLNEIARQHLKRAAHVAFEAYKEHAFDHLIIGAPHELANELERDLHSYLRERVAAHIEIPASASDADIINAALTVEESVERRKHAAFVERLRNAVGSGNGVAGLEGVLQAVVERRVDTLIVSDGYETEGWRCQNCTNLAVRGRECPVCAEEMTPVSDIVELALEEALRHSSTVKVCVGDADLDVMGRIGALLRF